MMYLKEEEAGETGCRGRLLAVRVHPPQLRLPDTDGIVSMMDGAAPTTTLTFDSATRALVRLAARIAGGSELDVRSGLRETAGAGTPEIWVEELILQSYLFCGFPRALNAAREWRRQVQVQGQGTGRGARDRGRDY